jgi:hypothetical protein
MGIAGMRRRQKEASGSFLKKRTKKLLSFDAPVGQRRWLTPALKDQSFFASFFSKKEVLSCLSS